MDSIYIKVQEIGRHRNQYFMYAIWPVHTCIPLEWALSRLPWPHTCILRCLMLLGSQDRSHSLPCPHGDRARVLQCSPGNVGSSWRSVTNTGVKKRERTDREAAGGGRKTSRRWLYIERGIGHLWVTLGVAPRYTQDVPNTSAHAKRFVRKWDEIYMKIDERVGGTHCHMNGFVWRLVLKPSQKATRKKPIVL